MSIRSGELVIISGANMKFIPNYLKSLRVRIVFLVMCCTIMTCFFLKSAILESYEQMQVAVRTSEIQNQCTILGNQLINSNYLNNKDSEVVNTELSQLSNIYSGRVMVIDDEFRIIKDTYNLDEGKTIISSDVVRCFRGEQTSNYDDKNRYIEVATPITSPADKNVLGMMLVTVSADAIQDNLHAIEGKANLASLTSGLVILVIACVAAVLLVKPFARMTRTIEDMAGGYGDQYLHENSYSETEQISLAFNKLWDRYKLLDASREEFVANVSHELKTPLTSMKVLSDSLLAQPDVPIELYQEFMGDLSEEIERENKIINDLLELVKMDKKGANLNIQSQNINELVERILKRLQPIAARQNVELVYESIRPVTAEVDEVKMSLALSNLVENAIKYNKENGWVHVALNADHKYFYIKVADSGIGIPKEDTEHIFERFYRVDKSHSRDIGGTGLGLSIARNAVVMHRGAIKVYSEPGEGTTFTVRIPLTYITK